MGTKKSGKPSSKFSEAELKSKGSFKISKEPLSKAVEGAEDPHKYEVTRQPQGSGEPSAPKAARAAKSGRVARAGVTAREAEELGELPSHYGETTLYLVARDPRWLFTYWEVDWSKYPASKMQKGEAKVFLKIYDQAGEEEIALEVRPEVRNWYVPVNTPGGTYTAELGYHDKKGHFVSIVRSKPVVTPSESLAEEEETADFVTVPLHLTFDRLVEMIKAKMGPSDSLATALARAQEEGLRCLDFNGSIPEWSLEQKRLLAALIGEELLTLTGLSSGEIQELLRKKLQQYLSSESASGLMAKSIAGMELSSLFSGITSWGGASLGGASWGSAAESSRLSSISPLGGLNLWGPESSNLSSGAFSSGVGASWSGQPFGQKRERGFFMHVNAEVIFYGGTDPNAKVWIDGKEIQLNADGTFRYHFKFPDGNYTIPIVAQSPDKVEERSATLSFERATGLLGEVTATAQPEHLTVPMGAR